MISVIVPSRGRPDLARRLFDSVKSTAKTDVEIKFYLNDDDPALHEYKKLLDASIYEIGPDQSTSFSWNKMSDNCKHDYVMLVGDDAQFLTNEWDRMIIDFFETYPKKDKILFVAPRDRAFREEKKWNMSKIDMRKPYKITTYPPEVGTSHFILHKNWINTLGYFLPPQFWHWFIDPWLTKVAVKLGRCYVLPYVEIKSKKIVDDDTGLRIRTRLNIAARDQDTYNRTRRHLISDVNALEDFIKNFKE